MDVQNKVGLDISVPFTPIGELLDEKIPRSVVSEREGGGGRRLSYLEGHYVIDRLNRVFGHLNWSKEITDVKEVINTTPKGKFPAYLVRVRLTVKLGGSEVVKEGYGYGSDKSGLNAHELAIKEAVTDALKVAAKDLGMSMGLALYDKTQENVSDEEIQVEVKEKQAQVASTTAPPQEDKLEDAVRSYYKVAMAQKKLTKDKFSTRLKELYQVEQLKSLTLDQMRDTLGYLQALTK